MQYPAETVDNSRHLYLSVDEPSSFLRDKQELWGYVTEEAGK